MELDLPTRAAGNVNGEFKRLADDDDVPSEIEMPAKRKEMSEGPKEEEIKMRTRKAVGERKNGSLEIQKARSMSGGNSQ